MTTKYTKEYLATAANALNRRLALLDNQRERGVLSEERYEKLRFATISEENEVWFVENKLKHMYVSHNEHQTIFCSVSPECPLYASLECPLWTFYNDGSFSRQAGESYFRSPAQKLRKPRNEFSLSDLQEILWGNEQPN